MTVFPTLQSPNWSLSRTPTWRTTAHTSSAGFRTRTPLRAKPIWKWTLKNAVLQSESTIADLQAIQDFFNARKGMLEAFLWRDPEQPSTVEDDPDAQVNVSGTYMWPVAFTVDSIEFERFAYQLWRCGTVSFVQLGDLSAYDLWNFVDHGPMTSAILALTSAYTVGTVTPANPIANITLWDVRDFGSTLNVGYLGFGHNNFVSDDATWAKRTDTFDVIDDGFFAVQGTDSDGDHAYDRSGLGALLSSLVVTTYHWNSLASTGDSSLDIYDCYLDITFGDGLSARFRPSSYNYIPSNDPDYGTIANPENAIDGDDTTYARTSAVAYGGLGHGWDPGILQLENFAWSENLP